MSESSFGPYRVVRKLGEGGMGVVYLGEHALIGRRAAIKVLHRERGAQRENVERFFNEARATSAVEDPGIVHIYDFGITTNDTAYLVMEYLDGESLSMRLRRRGPLSSHDAVRITRQIASSLAAAHAANIVHRDLKPENLFMVRDREALAGERPKILDFGIAKLGNDAGPDRFQTRTGAVMGTPAYMSPEQCNAGKIDPRTDIYSLGCVLFHLLTGRPPFDLEGVGAIIAAHLREPAPVPSQVAPHIPAIVDPLVAGCLAKNPDERFATMIALQQACDAVLGQLPVGAAVANGPELALDATARAEAVTTLGNSVGQVSGELRPRRGLWFAIGAAAIAAGIGLAVTTRPAASPTEVAPGAAPTQPMTITPLPATPPPAPRIEAPAAATASESTGATTPAPAAAAEPPPTPAPAAKPTHGKAPAKKPKPARDVYEDRI